MVSDGAINEYKRALAQWKDWAEKRKEEEEAVGGIASMASYFRGCLNIINSAEFLFDNLFRESEDAAC